MTPTIQASQVTLLPTAVVTKHNLMGRMFLRRPQRPVPAAHVPVRVRVWQVLAVVHVVDADGLGAPTDVVNLQATTCGVPFLVGLEGEAGGRGGNGGEGDEEEGGKCWKLHCVFG